MGKLNRIQRKKPVEEPAPQTLTNVSAGESSSVIEDDVEMKRQWEILARHDYAFYVEYVHHKMYKHGRHTEYICKVLEDVEQGKETRVILCLPPRHSKSMTVSETFPSWFIGRNPERRVIEVSYGDRLARRFGRLNKTKLMEFGPAIFNLRLPGWIKGQSSSTDWGVEGVDGEDHRGGMLSTGIGGSITGEGADLLLIDDPIKNREEAFSITYRNKIWEEWKNTLRTRLQPNGRVIIILTRWHEDDLVGRLLNPKYNDDVLEEGVKWKVISIPAIADSADDLLGRKKGEALWPEYGFDRSWAVKTKIEVGSSTWTSLYQQRPQAQEGGLIKRDWWKYYNPKALPDFLEIVQSWDCAFEEQDRDKKTQDYSYTVCTTWGRTLTAIYLLDVFRKQIEFPELIRTMKSMYGKWNPNAVLVEYKASGKSSYQALRQETLLPLLPVSPHKSKVVRMDLESPMIEAGNVYLPQQAVWLHDYIDELSMFPNGENDDQVDSTSQGLKYFRERSKVGARGIVVNDEYDEEEQTEENGMKMIPVKNEFGDVLDEEGVIPILVGHDLSKMSGDEIRRKVIAERYGIPEDEVVLHSRVSM